MSKTMLSAIGHRGITTRQASELASHVTPEKLLKAILSKHSSAKRYFQVLVSCTSL